MMKYTQKDNDNFVIVEDRDVINLNVLLAQASNAAIAQNTLVYEKDGEIYILENLSELLAREDITVIIDDNPIHSIEELAFTLEQSTDVIVKLFDFAGGGLSYTGGPIGAGLNYHDLLIYTDFGGGNQPGLNFTGGALGAAESAEESLNPSLGLNTPGSEVYEAGLRALTAVISPDMLTTTGVMAITMQDIVGGISLTVDGVTILSNGILMNTIIIGDYGTLTILSYNPSTNEVSWSYTMDQTNGQGVDHSNGQIFDNFDVKVSDLTGAYIATDLLTIEIIDDIPLANDDGREVGIPLGGFVIDGNVFKDGNDTDVADEIGADNEGAHLIYIETSDGTRYSFPSSFDALNPASLTIETENGTLTINQLGEYSYVTKGSHPDIEDIFHYGIVDGDGDEAGATLSMDLVNVITQSSNNITVDEQYVPTSDTRSLNFGSHPDDALAEVTGDIRELTGYNYENGSWTNDGSTVFSFEYTHPQTGEVVTGIYSSEEIEKFTFSIQGATTQVINGVTWYILEADVLDANGQFVAGGDGEIDFTFKLSENGDYSFKIHTYVDHSINAIQGSGLDGEALNGLVDDLIIGSLNITFTDSVGTSGDLTLELNVHDDVPQVVADTTLTNTLIAGWNTDDLIDAASITGRLVTPVQESYHDSRTNAGLDGTYNYHYAIEDVNGNWTTLTDGVAMHIEGTYGYIDIAADGHYLYTAYSVLQLAEKGIDVTGLTGGELVTETFTYRLFDGDGDWVEAHLSVNILAPYPEGTSDLTVSEEGLNNPKGTLNLSEDEINQGNLLENNDFPVYFEHELNGEVKIFQEIGTELYFEESFTAGTNNIAITVAHQDWMDDWSNLDAADIPTGWVNNGSVYSYGDPNAQGFVLYMDTDGNYYYEITSNFNHSNPNASGADDILMIIEDLTFGVVSDKGNIGSAVIDLNVEDDAPDFS